MNAHWVKIFDGANDDAVIRLITHDLHFKLFPTDQGFFNQQLFGRRKFQPAFADGFKFFSVIGNTAAGASHGKAGADDQGITAGLQGGSHTLMHLPSLLHAMCNPRKCRGKSNLGHGFFELEPVFGFFYRLLVSTYHLNVVAFQHTMAMQIQGAIKSGLSSHRGQ